MLEDLYFIPIIGRAMGRAQSRAALEHAFKRIRRLGRQRPHKRGFGQFLQFMALVSEAQTVEHTEEPVEIPKSLQRPTTMELVLEGNGTPVANLTLRSPPDRLVVGDVEPGEYRLRLDTGWVVWEGYLSEEHLLWSKAFPSRPLPAAADTGIGEPPATIQENLLGGVLVVRACPGLAGGSLVIDRIAEETPG